MNWKDYRNHDNITNTLYIKIYLYIIFNVRKIYHHLNSIYYFFGQPLEKNTSNIFIYVCLVLQSKKIIGRIVVYIYFFFSNLWDSFIKFQYFSKILLWKSRLFPIIRKDRRIFFSIFFFIPLCPPTRKIKLFWSFHPKI